MFNSNIHILTGFVRRWPSPVSNVCFLKHVPRKHAGGWLTVFWLSPYKTSKSPSQPGGVPPSAAGLRWIVKKCRWPSPPLGGKRSHARNRHLGNHRGCSVAFSKGFSVAFSNIVSRSSGIVQRIVTLPVASFHWNSPMDTQWHVPMEFHTRAFWCVRPVRLLGVWISEGLTQANS